MTIDPHQLDDDAIKRELDQAMAGMSPADLAELTHPDDHRAPPPPPADRSRLPGRIVAIRGPDVFVDIGGKAEAFLTLDEFEPDQPPQIGQLLHFVAQGFDRDSGLMRLSLREARAEADWSSVRVGDVLEGRVTGLNIGGLELTIKGIRAFMPKSQVDIHRVEDFKQFLGHRMECEVVEIDRRHKSVTVSRRNILERQREQEREQVRGGLEVGQVRKGVVRRIAEFGAFVDIGGIDGLLHVSDLSYARVRSPADVLKVGDTIDVQILKIDRDRDRISLGRKQLETDPWTLVPANYRPGVQVDGRVTKLMPFGAFVEVEPGVEGLIPISEMSWTTRINHPKDVLSEGDSVRVAVLAVDADNRKISLSLKALATDPWQSVTERYAPEAITSGLVKRITNFGAFIQLEEGIEGLAHISELSDKHVRTVSDAVAEGQVVKVRILSVDPEQRKISLSLKRTDPEAEAAAAAAAAAYAAAHPPPPPPKKKERPMRGGLAW